MKKLFYSSRHKGSISYFFMVFAVCLLILAGTVVPAGATGASSGSAIEPSSGTTATVPATEVIEKGWLEVKATLAEEINSYIVLSLICENTQDDLAVPILPEDGFYAKEEVPVGTYSISAVWVYQDYRYTVTPSVNTFVVEKDTSTTIELSVSAPGPVISMESVSEEEEFGEEVSDSEKVFEPELEVSEKKEGYSKKQVKESSSIGFWKKFLISAVGLLLFGGIFFGIYFVSRKKFH